MKRKRKEESAPLAQKKESAPLSSNWLQLQATLGRQGKRKKNVTTSDAAVPANPTGGGIKSTGTLSCLFPTSSDFSVTRILALDCEMVGVGPEGKRSALARVSIVNVWGNVVYDKHVRPAEYITDFRTSVSGIRPRDLRTAEDFGTIQKEVAELLKGRILVGHALHNDLKLLLVSHPRRDIRDTQLYKPLRSHLGRPQALKHLAAMHLGANIQEKEHDSIEDARAALCLYQQFKESWEKDMKHPRKGEQTSSSSQKK